MSPSPLADAFCQALPPSLEGRFGKGEGLEASLRQLVQRARTEWPELDAEDASFVEHLAQRVAADSALEALHAGDLYLAFACLLGDPAALAAFDARMLSRVPPALRGALPEGLTEDDVLQSLRLKLFLRESERPPRIASYSGRGALLHWLRAAAVRVVQDFARLRKVEVASTDEALADTPAVSADADAAYLKGRYAPEFKAAFQEALAQLPSREQGLLRLYYLDGLSPEEIGRLYRTHRTTIWRQLTQCRRELLVKTRTLLAARVQVSDGELSSLMNAVHSQLDVSLSRVLRGQ